MFFFSILIFSSLLFLKGHGVPEYPAVFIDKGNRNCRKIFTTVSQKTPIYCMYIYILLIFFVNKTHPVIFRLEYG